MNIGSLVSDIQTLSRSLQENAVRAINQHVTARNWLIGYRIIHYEQHGDDRAAYGAKVLETFAENLKNEGLSYRNLRLYRQFYLLFPELLGEVESFLLSNLPSNHPSIGQIWQAPLAKLQSADDKSVDDVRMSTIGGSTDDILVPPDLLFNKLSYSHLVF